MSLTPPCRCPENRTGAPAPGGSRALRFPGTAAVLAEALDAADPMGLGTPRASGGYEETVQEILTLLVPRNGDLAVFSPTELAALLHDTLTGCFGRTPDRGRLKKAALRIEEEAAAGRHLPLPGPCGEA